MNFEKTRLSPWTVSANPWGSGSSTCPWRSFRNCSGLNSESATKHLSETALFLFGCRRILPSVILNRACGSFRGLRLFTISDSLLQLVAEILRQIFTGFASFLFFNLLERDLNAWMRLQTVFNLNAQLGIQVILLRQFLNQSASASRLHSDWFVVNLDRQNLILSSNSF